MFHVTIQRIVWGSVTMRFILLSFGFMGWAFYELSGGSEFDPAVFKAEQIAAYEAEKALAKKTERRAEPAPVRVASAPKVDVADAAQQEADVTRVSLNLTTLQSVIGAEEDTSPNVAENPISETTPVPENVSVITSSVDTPAIIPSLIASSNDGATATTIALQTASFEVRTVAGSRVNVRGGPGTSYGVVGGLVRGDQIKVLEEDGTGWVRFETVDGITAGWMAEFLLADG